MSVRMLPVPGVETLMGRGVYYGASLSEAAFYRGKDVCIIGGANSAGQGALFFARHARTVTMIVRAAGLRPTMSHYLAQRIQETENIRVMTGTEVVGVRGDVELQEVRVRNTATGAECAMPAAAMFIYIGAAPRSEFVQNLLERNEKGFIVTGPDLHRSNGRPRDWTLVRDPLMFETNVPGVFAAGDVRAGADRRVASAVGEGSAAIYSIRKYLETV
jgi:thioredoxin reductase (NADPH)